MKSERFSNVIDSPLGEILIVVDQDDALLEISFLDSISTSSSVACDPARGSAAASQLVEYFEGTRRIFDLPISALIGTHFQRRVWQELLGVAYGTTVTYRALATRIGRPSAIRAVGSANGSNPLCIVIPCHRVIGSNGRLTGYGGGLDRKRALLDLEGRTGSHEP